MDDSSDRENSTPTPTPTLTRTPTPTNAPTPPPLKKSRTETSEKSKIFVKNKTSVKIDNDRVRIVLGRVKFAENYSYDSANSRWCKMVFRLPLSASKLDINNIVSGELEKFVVHAVPGIEKCMLRETSGIFSLQTQGINLEAFTIYSNELNLSRMYCNDIHKMAQMYGIEAAYQAILKVKTFISLLKFLKV